MSEGLSNYGLEYTGKTVDYKEKDNEIYFEIEDIAAASLDANHTMKIGINSYLFSLLVRFSVCGILGKTHGQKLYSRNRRFVSICEGVLKAKVTPCKRRKKQLIYTGNRAVRNTLQYKE